MSLARHFSIVFKQARKSLNDRGGPRNLGDSLQKCTLPPRRRLGSYSTTTQPNASNDPGTMLPSATETEERIHPTDVIYDLKPSVALPVESQNKVDVLFEKIVWLDMIEVHLLTQLVHERMGGKWRDLESSGQALRTTAAPTTNSGDQEGEEKVIFDLKLMGFDAKAKIKVIKEVRAIAGLGLKEAKELVESAPKVVQKDLKQDKADELKAQLEAVGAQVQVI